MKCSSSKAVYHFDYYRQFPTRKNCRASRFESLNFTSAVISKMILGLTICEFALAGLVSSYGIWQKCDMGLCLPTQLHCHFSASHYTGCKVQVSTKHVY